MLHVLLPFFSPVTMSVGLTGHMPSLAKLAWECDAPKMINTLVVDCCGQFYSTGGRALVFLWYVCLHCGVDDKDDDHRREFTFLRVQDALLNQGACVRACVRACLCVLRYIIIVKYQAICVAYLTHRERNCTNCYT